MTVYEKFLAAQRQIEHLEEQGGCLMLSSARACLEDAAKGLKYNELVSAEMWVEKCAKYLWGTMRPEHWNHGKLGVGSNGL